MLHHLIKLFKSYHTEIVLAIAIISITIISFNFGKISEQEKYANPIKIISPDGSTKRASPNSANEQGSANIRIGSSTENSGGDGVGGMGSKDISNVPVVVSKKSKSGAFHYPWCPGAGRIAEENKLTYKNAAAAISAGYHLAGNCRE